ncbi:MAG: RhuM family protein [Lachnospiraceae bacterium]
MALIGRNYLTKTGLKVLNNLVSGCFDFVEINAIEHRPMYMSDYINQLDTIQNLEKEAKKQLRKKK